MERIKIAESSKAPRILLDPEDGILIISGKSIPENADDLYTPLLDGISRYFSEIDKPLSTTIDLEYFNTASARKLMLLFKMLEGKNSSVEWVYEEGDLDMKECGEDYKAIVNDLEFKLVEKPE